MYARAPLRERGLNTGKKARLHRLLHQFGLRNGTALFLPYDHGFEHGPRDFLPKPVPSRPYTQVWKMPFGLVPILLVTRFTSALPRRKQILRNFVRCDLKPKNWACRSLFGLTPRGEAIDAKGGNNSFYPIDYAARVASELGADFVKVNFPHPDLRRNVKKEYDFDFTSQQAIDTLVKSANKTLVLVSGGKKSDDGPMFEKARESMEAGATGLIFGRNIWQREDEASLKFVDSFRQILERYPSS